MGSRHVLQVGHLGRNMHGGLEQSWHLVVRVDEWHNTESENACAGFNMLQVSHLTLCVCAWHSKQQIDRLVLNLFCHIEGEYSPSTFHFPQSWQSMPCNTLEVCASHSKQQIDRSSWNLCFHIEGEYCFFTFHFPQSWHTLPCNCGGAALHERQTRLYPGCKIVAKTSSYHTSPTTATYSCVGFSL